MIWPWRVDNYSKLVEVVTVADALVKILSLRMLMFGWDFEVNAKSRFWNWNFVKNCVRTCDMNSTFGSVVPLAMFVDIFGKEFFCFVAVGPLANAKDNLIHEHRFINTSNITMTFHFRPFIPCRLWRWSNRILYSIEAAFIAIYWMAGLYVTYIYPNYEQYKSC